jgi:hypothetical protein
MKQPRKQPKETCFKMFTFEILSRRVPKDFKVREIKIGCSSCYTTTSTMLIDDIYTFYRVENGCDYQPLYLIISSDLSFRSSRYFCCGFLYNGRRPYRRGQPLSVLGSSHALQACSSFFPHESSRGHEKGIRAQPQVPNRLYRPRTQGY